MHYNSLVTFSFPEKVLTTARNIIEQLGFRPSYVMTSPTLSIVTTQRELATIRREGAVIVLSPTMFEMPKDDLTMEDLDSDEHASLVAKETQDIFLETDAARQHTALMLHTYEDDVITSEGGNDGDFAKLITTEAGMLQMAAMLAQLPFSAMSANFRAGYMPVAFFSAKSLANHILPYVHTVDQYDDFGPNTVLVLPDPEVARSFTRSF